MSLFSRIKSWFEIKDSSPVFPTDTTLLQREGFVPDHFQYGVEIFNDNTTPMPFVVKTLKENLKITEKKAIDIMLEIHAKGGVIIPLESMEQARYVADAITSDADRMNHNLVCRAISAL